MVLLKKMVLGTEKTKITIKKFSSTDRKTALWMLTGIFLATSAGRFR